MAGKTKTKKPKTPKTRAQIWKRIVVLAAVWVICLAFAGINRSYLFTLFQEHLHQSPQEYLTNFKIHRACELLRTTQYSLQNIAHSCGYKDAVVFSKAFKQVKGIAPGQYRKQCLNAGLIK